MALLHISEYAEMGFERAGHLISAPKEPALVDQTVDFSAGEATSAAFGAGARYVLLTADVKCHIKFGVNPTATTSNKPIWAQGYAGFGIDPQSGLRVSVIGAA